ncbi:PUA-like domain-containing protein [Sparassis latifolia]|uniref:EVE domain-containing protein n=1 Tax=Sparassis crispa TaxID=139825 RepID=A0A401GDB3_9APHY|nr:Uncharacterized protein SCP_0213160 [Sparassis crispa]GBE80113.1 Uncharacterized protein SCP_0213160 [Sparassis crispa]
MSPRYWLMKAEPDSRVVKGKDVKFSVDDFESVKTTPWEGVRNAEARNLMREMEVGDKVLFYHSNCKKPGIAGFAEVSREAYPDYTAWDSSHPYYDPKTDKENPKWYMVDVTFINRTAHFVPLALLRRIAAAGSEPPTDVSYIGESGTSAIKQMALVTRGRLSVQRVEEDTWGVIEELAAKGGWTEEDATASKKKGKKTGTAQGQRSRRKATKSEEDRDEVDTGSSVVAGDMEGSSKDKASANEEQPTTRKRKAKFVEEYEASDTTVRRSTRARK